MTTDAAHTVTVTLNAAVDQTVMIPGFAAGRVNRVADFRSDAGGKGINVAAFLADYGLPVTATGFLGRDNADLFERFFNQKNIADRFVRIAGSTRTGIKIVDEQKDQTTDINFPGQAPASPDLKLLFETIAALSAAGRWFVAAGSIPSGTSAGVYREMITAISERGGRVALDTSGEGFRQALAGMPALIKPNIDELQEYSGQSLNTEGEIIGAARQFLDRGIRTVVVSMGEKGALFVEEKQTVFAAPPRVRVKSTVGAGDAMVAGMVAGKIEQKSLQECARLATAFSVIAVTHVGAGIPSDVSLESIARQVQIREPRG